ncbi:2a744ecb-b7f9-4ff3-bf45-b479611c3a5f [Sclerotinia trifoliorum]|uniref:2a744ecb-b7f9-4ff3-bf45-b479611c3a5f n=1 Tax=Sclerotinia trifoliorum TaxID=28548 RepID=A0A8H2ZY66_9HELO|nr:2a744ecb-b7f9-4ff3-bf45-b479611c3a5f [Sclerotinia trifoliorum]
MGSSKAVPSEQKKKSKSKSSSKSSAKVSTKTPVAKSPQNFKSSEFVGESDNENDEPMGNNSDSDSDSDNDSLPSNPAKSTPKSKSKSNGKAAESSDSSEAESEEESESGSGSDKENEQESESENESNANGKKSAVAPPSKKDAKTVSMKVAPFKPPPGFEKTSSKNSSITSQLFNKSNLEGKEIWYITAPASVPINSVKEISLQDAKLGKAVFSHDDNDYGFINDPLEDKTYTKILIPSNPKDGYSIERKPVDQIYHMQQVVNISKENSSQATVLAKRPVRQQPKGLKARFQPIGFASAPGIIGSDEDESDSEERAPKFQKIAMSEDEISDVEMEDAPPSLNPAKKSKSDKSKKSQKDSQESADRSSKKKHKDTGDRKKKHKKADSN